MANKSKGTKLKKGEDAIAELTSISGLDISADTIETTTLEDEWRTYKQGTKDAGEVGISGYFDKTHNALYEDFKTGEAVDYTIEFPDALGAKWTFKGIVTKFTTGAEKDDNISFEASLKVTGPPTLTVSE